MKKILKYILFFGFLMLNFSQIFALDANISLDENKVNINDYIRLKISINSKKGGEINIEKINGIKNFKIIGSSQSQSSDTKIITLNGKTKTQTKIENYFYITLEAKKNGNFIIGPVIINDGKNKIETNIVSVLISGDKNFLNNSKSKDEINNLDKNFGRKNEKNSFRKTFFFYYLSFLVIIFCFVFLLWYKNNKLIFLDFVQDKLFFWKDEKNFKQKNISFEIKKQEKFVYPDIRDENFSFKIGKIFREKIGKNFDILNIKNKTYEEILKEINSNDKNEILQIITLLNKIKYSNLVVNKTKLLEKIKNLFE